MSSANDIQGRNCIFQMKVDNDYLDVLCAKTFSFNRAIELKETTTVQSGFDKEFRPRKKSYTISFNGVVQVVADGNKPTIKTLFDHGEGFLPVFYRLIYEDNSGNVMVIMGQAYVSSSIFSANPINLLDGTTELTGNGPIEISDVVPDPATITITSLGDNSINAQFQFKLFDANGAVVFDSGQLPGASGGNLTHPVSVSGQIQKGMYSIFWQGDAQSIANTFQLDAPPTKSEIFDNVLTNESTFGIQEYDFTSNRTVTFTVGVIAPPPVCVPPVVLVPLNNRIGKEGYLYVGVITVGGSEPFNLTNIVKPIWFLINILPGGIITLQGYPLEGNGQVVSFDINNACGSVSYSDTIDIEQNTDLVPINWDYTEDGGLAAPGAFVIYRNSVKVVDQGTTASSTLMVNPGDIIEVRLNGLGSSVQKNIDVVNTDGPVDSVSSTSSTVNVSFSVIAGKVYDITASKVNV